MSVIEIRELRRRQSDSLLVFHFDDSHLGAITEHFTLYTVVAGDLLATIGGAVDLLQQSVCAAVSVI